MSQPQRDLAHAAGAIKKTRAEAWNERYSSGLHNRIARPSMDSEVSACFDP